MFIVLFVCSISYGQINVAESADTIGRYEIYELTIDHDDESYTNTWEEVVLSAQFSIPDGQVFTIDGFYYNTDLWKVRFTPPIVGEWSWTITFLTPTNNFSESGSFTCELSERPGFVQLHPTNPFRLILKEESLFNAIGIGDCILDADGNGELDEWGFDGDFRPEGQHDGWTVDMPTYMAAYGDSGAGFNLFRWGVDNCSFKLWESISTDGNRYLVQEGLRGDELVEALREYGFRIWLTFFGHEAANNQAEQAAAERYLRYVIARYGAYIDIWELLNETEVSDAWIVFTADFVRAIDPYNRLITTSWERPQLPEIDINAPHWYEKESEFESDLRTSQNISEAKQWGKQVIFGEQGNSVQNWDNRSALRMRLRSWTAFFEEGVLIFWNSSFAKDYFAAGAASLYIGPEERGYIRALQDFTADVDADVERFELTPTNQEIRAYGLQSPQMILGYFHHFTSHTDAVNITVTLNVPDDGIMIWIDPATGDTLQSTSISSGTQTLTSPSFTVDLALKIQFDTAAVIDDDPALPNHFVLDQNYPNPFNPVTTISYQLPKSSIVNLAVYNIAGRLVQILVNEYENAGHHSVEWNASSVGSGVYFYRIGTGEYTETKKCLVLK